MQSLVATNDVCTMPVYRPLIGYDKQEIVNISEKIGTFETSIQPFEDCCTIFAVSYTHLDVYKRQGQGADVCGHPAPDAGG